ncbi:MBL fold metallo-hydrolase [Rhizobium sp. 16-449-1b]|uniref:MBL fold metallo-hydrolase n=1 Tax=Rhizobium sp. 16-449-1b TaxID=2819989 RepID=UPI001ADCEA21|nr:MBL fold metallo-hydrolase [Rhizobium sp. 16-449-1b]MBO9198379.1 MBL fold metallo-hydrolase [Rhizobium sp. 16-449-1b]
MDVTLQLTSYPGLDERITILRVGDEVDVVLVQTERFNILVDTLATPALCRQALDLLAEKMGRRPLLVINSHMDWDHFWGNAAFDHSVPIIAHAAAVNRLRDPAAQQLLAEKKQELRFQAVELVAPNITFDGETMALHGGDLTLELIHTPGHTPDHIAVWVPEIRTCLAVDTVEHPIPEVWSSDPADLCALITSLKRIRDLQADYVVLAHGQRADTAVADANLRYFAWLRDRIAGLGEIDIDVVDLAGLGGVRLQDLVAVPEDMPAETRAFYERCHRSNLAAVLAAHKAGIEFILDDSHG